MKKLKLKKKAVIVLALIIVAVIGIISLVIFLASGKKEDVDKETDKSPEKVAEVQEHAMYVKINPLVKINFTENYQVCKNKDKEEICSEIETVITSVELVNEDAQKVYKDIDFTGKNLEEAMLILCDKASENNIAFDDVYITTDSTNVNDEALILYVYEHSEYDNYFYINVEAQEELTEPVGDNQSEESNEVEAKPVENKTEDNKNKYIVTFNTNGGGRSTNTLVVENGKVTKPANPTRSGYKFIEWQLDGKAYNFNSPVTKNITLVAKWESLTGEDEESSKTFTITSINKKNLDSSYTASFPTVPTIKVTISGKKEDVDKVKQTDISLYVDLEDVELGEQSLKIKYDSITGITFKLTPDAIKVKVCEDDDCGEEEEITSTLEKINLNDNIKVKEDIMGHNGCGSIDYIFITNQQEVFKDYGSYFTGKKFNKHQFDLALGENKYAELKKSFEFDSERESNASTSINALNPGIGIIGYEHSFTEHYFTYTYKYLALDNYEKYGSFGLQYYNSQKSFKDKLDGIFNNAIEVWDQACGEEPKVVTLTEELCTKYNLTCDKW